MRGLVQHKCFKAEDDAYLITDCGRPHQIFDVLHFDIASHTIVNLCRKIDYSGTSVEVW